MIAAIRAGGEAGLAIPLHVAHSHSLLEEKNTLETTDKKFRYLLVLIITETNKKIKSKSKVTTGYRVLNPKGFSFSLD